MAIGCTTGSWGWCSRSTTFATAVDGFTTCSGAELAFTVVTLTGAYTAGGAPAAGQLTFTLTQPLQNGDQIATTQPVVVTLNASGSFSVGLVACDDPATVPQGVWWAVTEQITGAQPRDYFIVLSHLVNPVDISTLMPGQGAWA